ncbi:hypothetical protein C4B68_01955 [Streptomyces dengpaensis]|uniref:Enoyl reductase (ER) domain-containing protein n=1 Tax=Streptomyces dengpaensis TaxID=2049881 RepID=A0ABM6SJU7_9ACTN|nr:hypothetical protein C4B68_01955 [Streptomyces dengpaensis]
MGAINEPGFYAERAAVHADQVARIPEGVSFISAAALPIASLSAWYTLRRLADLQPGESVLINAAAGGVGSAAVQIAAEVGATVIATAGSQARRDWVSGLGAEHVLDSRTTSSDERVGKILQLTDGQGVHVALDLVGGDAFGESLTSLAHGGRVISAANVALQPSTIDTRDFYPKNARIYGFQITGLIEDGYDARGDLTDLLARVAHRRLTVPVDAAYELTEAGKAHAHLEQRTNQGKIVLAVRHS